MKRLTAVKIQSVFLCICSLAIILLFTACSGVAGTGTATGSGTGASTTITGSVQSVNASAHSVTVIVSANGQQQQLTVSGLTDQQVQDLQAHIGKIFAIQATGSGTSYTINTNTTPQEEDNATPGVTAEATTSSSTSATTGSVDFLGKVQNMNVNNVVVSMPNGQPLTLNINAQTDRADLQGQANVGQYIKVKAIANPDGSFTVTKLGSTDSGDTQDQNKLNTVTFTGVTTGAVGTDNVVHFNVGNKGFSFPLAQGAEVKDFANAQAIGNNQAVKVDVLFTGANGSILKVANGSD